MQRNRAKSELNKEHWYKYGSKSIETSYEYKVTILWNERGKTGRTIPNNNQMS
jgi:hypothetical protein